MKQLALENGKFGIRVNGINADKIRSGLLNKELIKEDLLIEVFLKKNI